MSEYQPQMTAHSAVELVVSVVDVSKGEKVLHVYRDGYALIDFVCMAHGTARTEMLDLLGIGETAEGHRHVPDEPRRGTRAARPSWARAGDALPRTGDRVFRPDYRDRRTLA